MDGIGSIYTRIRAMAEKLPATEARIARYVLEHPDEVIRQSITEAAETC
ncbi:MAG: RpiR family transcriptional regulator, partial [Bacilli bacterium]